jgi:hypothetical protein
MKHQRIHGEPDGVPEEDFGRLVRISRRQGDRKLVAYIVAVRDAPQAIEFIRQITGAPADTIENVCRVSAALLKALDLRSGDFAELRGDRQKPPATALVLGTLLSVTPNRLTLGLLNGRQSGGFLSSNIFL